MEGWYSAKDERGEGNKRNRKAQNDSECSDGLCR